MNTDKPKEEATLSELLVQKEKQYTEVLKWFENEYDSSVDKDVLREWEDNAVAYRAQIKLLEHILSQPKVSEVDVEERTMGSYSVNQIIEMYKSQSKPVEDKEIIEMKKASEQYRKGFTQCLKEVKEYSYDVIAKYDKERIKATEKVEDKEVSWETFFDTSYYDLWAVRPIGDKNFGSQKLFHVQSKEEAEALKDILNLKYQSKPVEEREVLLVVKVSERNPTIDTREMYITIIKEKIDSKVSLKPAYSEWYFNRWNTDENYEVYEWLEPISKKELPLLQEVSAEDFFSKNCQRFLDAGGETKFLSKEIFLKFASQLKEEKLPYGNDSIKCNFCQQWFDMSDLQQVFDHEHDDLEKPSPNKGVRVKEREEVNEVAVEFAEWILKEEWYAEDGKWYDTPFTGKTRELTTEELYSLYKQSK